MKIVVLGAGLVGGPMAMDLALEPSFNVHIYDRDPEALFKLNGVKGITTHQADLSDKQKLTEIVKSSDLVINAVPGFMGYKTLENIIKAGRDVVDIAFFPENPFELSALAEKHGVTAIVDCGVAPGMSHMLTGLLESEFDQLEKVRIFVGGLPVVRKWPYEYKAVFSPIDVIEEYTRPARLVRDGEVVFCEALSEPELLDLPHIGTLEAFNSDGLRTLTETIKVRDMAEKTLRYPGHIALMKVLRHSGFFEKEAIELPSGTVVPVELTSKLFQKDWKLQPGEQDLTVMQVYGEGSRNNKHQRISFDLLDYFDTASGVHSMARTTGYTATVVARLLAAGKIKQKGIIVPEYLGRDSGLMDKIFSLLSERGIIYRRNEETI